MQIPAQEYPEARRIHRRKFQKNGAGVLFGAGEPERIDVFGRASVLELHGFGRGEHEWEHQQRNGDSHDDIVA
jgi:hypothetical protein